MYISGKRLKSNWRAMCTKTGAVKKAKHPTAGELSRVLSVAGSSPASRGTCCTVNWSLEEVWRGAASSPQSYWRTPAWSEKMQVHLLFHPRCCCGDGQGQPGNNRGLLHPGKTQTSEPRCHFFFGGTERESLALNYSMGLRLHPP